GQQQRHVTPAQLDGAEHGQHVAAVAVTGGVLVVLATHTGRARAALARGVQPVQQCGEHVEFGGVGMLGTVVLTRDRPEHLGGGLPGLVDEGLGLLRDFEIDHAVTTPSMTPIARRSRYQRATGCSLMNPCPPSSWTPVLPIHMPLSVSSLRASATS